VRLPQDLRSPDKVKEVAELQSIRVAIFSRSIPVGAVCSPNSMVTDSIVPVKGNKPFFS